MKNLICKIFLFVSVLTISLPAQAALDNGYWINDARSVFLKNRAIILAINIRNFNAQDKNNDDIIEHSKGEVSGNFVNAINRLDEIRKQGFNTIHVLPVTPVGKVKAIGTAGSLYAISDFTKLNDQLDDKTNNLSVFDEAKRFVDECHKRNIRVIFDLPSCGSYDMYLANPNLFMKDENGQPILPYDWTDVRVFKTQNSDGSLNHEVYDLYKKYIDMVQRLGVDGIRADVATMKPFDFWKNLISYARKQDNEFLFIAEASENWSQPVASNVPFTPYHRLLDAGFDGWYGNFFAFKDWEHADKIEKEFLLFQSVLKDYSNRQNPKAVIGSFSTHDELSPINIGGSNFSRMIAWLQATLPINSYFVDGFQTGDAYQYKYANRKAENSFTDDDYYYVHKGKFDIFNLSRKPGSTNQDLLRTLVITNNFKSQSVDMMENGTFEIVKTSNPKIFAYYWTRGYSKILVILNKDFKYNSVGNFSLKDYQESDIMVPICVSSKPIIEKKQINLDMLPAEIIVFLISKKDNNSKKNTNTSTTYPVYR